MLLAHSTLVPMSMHYGYTNILSLIYVKAYMHIYQPWIISILPYFLTYILLSLTHLAFMIGVIRCVTRHILILTSCHSNHFLYHDLVICNMALSPCPLYVVTYVKVSNMLFPYVLWLLCYAPYFLVISLYWYNPMSSYSRPWHCAHNMSIHCIRHYAFMLTYQGFVLALGYPLARSYYFRLFALLSPKISILWFQHILPLKNILSDFHSYRRRHHICLSKHKVFVKS